MMDNHASQATIFEKSRTKGMRGEIAVHYLPIYRGAG